MYNQSSIDASFDENNNALRVNDINLQKTYNPEIEAIDIAIQDQTSEVVDYYVIAKIGSTTVASACTVDCNTIKLASMTNVTTDLAVNIIEDGRMYQGVIIDVNGSYITLNAPLDFALTTNSTVDFGYWNLNRNGSVTPVVCSIAPPDGVKWDINAISVNMTDSDPMDETKFGGLNQLVKGVLFRKKDGLYKNILVVHNNGMFRDRGFTVDYPAKVPSGTYSFGGRKIFNSQSGNGVAVRLDGAFGEELQIVISDDLTGLTRLVVNIHGHNVVQ